MTPALHRALAALLGLRPDESLPVDVQVHAGVVEAITAGIELADRIHARVRGGADGAGAALWI